MTPKELEYKLDNYYHHQALKDSIDRLDTLKAEYDALYPAAGGMQYDSMPHSPNPGDPTLEAVQRMADKPEELRAEIERKRQEILEIHRTDEAIECALHKLEPREEEIVHLRHCEKISNKEAANAMHYSEDWARHLYSNTICKILGMI